VRIRGARVATAYIGDAEASADAFRDGGFYPGDIGRLGADGVLIIEGRADDRMNLGGFKLMPGVVEAVALECPGVTAAAAFAAPDERGLDCCWLAVVRGPDFDRQRLVDHLAASPVELPDIRFAWTEAIPRNAMGKIERRRLRQEAAAALGLGPPA
jgi:acyl-CoA synthetase (AMP-forming)/AMP-acid ligase II